MCPQGTYTAKNATTSCQTCPDLFPASPEGSTSLAECQKELVTVMLKLGLPMTMVEFTETKEMSLKHGVANTAGVHVSLVKIVDKFQTISTRCVSCMVSFARVLSDMCVKISLSPHLKQITGIVKLMGQVL